VDPTAPATPARPTLDPDVLAQGAVVAAAVAQVATAALGARRRGERDSVEELSNSFPVTVVPANYAFAIWGPIYGASLALAGYQARSTQRTDTVLRRLRWPAAAAYAGNAVWVLAFTSQRYRLALGCILTTLVGATTAHVRASTTEEPLDRSRAWLVRTPLGLLAGWITVATPSAVAITALATGRQRLVMGPAGWAPPLLVTLGGITTAVTRALPTSAAFPGAVAWGLTGVAANTRVPGSARASAALAAAVVVASTARTTLSRRVRGGA